MDAISFPRALGLIQERSMLERGFISDPFGDAAAALLGQTRTAALLERLGSPHHRYGLIHVAGSKGKGSTCAFASAILTQAGYKTGRCTSPHLHSFRERIAIDGREIGQAEFTSVALRVDRAARELEIERPTLGRVTAFEFLTVMALVHFADSEVELALIEVGLGGRLDPTNVVSPLASVVTTLDFEHTAILGESMAEIAGNKAGIIKPGVPVVSASQEPDAVAVIEREAARCESRVLLGRRDWNWSGSRRSFALEGPWGRLANLQSPLAGDHQIENAGCAVAAIHLIAGAGFPVSESAIRAGLANPNWPGRYEVIAPSSGGRAAIVLDGAHTPRSAHALAAAFAADYPGQRASIVLGILNDKDPLAIASGLAPIAEAFILAASASPRALSPDALRSAIAPLNVPLRASPSIAAAIETIPRDGLGIVTGSLTAVADARRHFGLGEPDPNPEFA